MEGIVKYTIHYADGSEMTLRLRAIDDRDRRLGSASGTLEVSGIRSAVEVTYAYPCDEAPFAIVEGAPANVMREYGREVRDCALRFREIWEEADVDR